VNLIAFWGVTVCCALFPRPFDATSCLKNMDVGQLLTAKEKNNAGRLSMGTHFSSFWPGIKGTQACLIGFDLFSQKEV
jgi:hypothetical protein